MLEKFLEQYVDSLYNRQNTGAVIEQQGLYSKKKYYELLKPVMQLVAENSDYPIEELRKKLFDASHIRENLNDFIYKKEMVPGLVFSYGTKNYKETVVIGNRQEVSLSIDGHIIPALEKMTEDTIFDLASVTKLFTSLSILKLVQDGLISMDDEVVKYCPKFQNLKGVTIYDLMTFGVPLKTNGRVDKAQSREEAEQILYDIEVDQESKNMRPYTDMGAMVLKYVIESVCGTNYYTFIDEKILKPLKMNDTHVAVPKYKIERVASTNLDGLYYKDGNFSITKNAPKGVVYDPKARILGQADGNLSGHAGLFSTANDMTALAKGIINGQVIDEEYVEMMAKNRTGKKYIEDGKEKYIQYLGMLCYSKNPVLANSELFHAMSGKSLASAGWTGTQLTINPINELYFFMAGNRSHNRMTFIDASQRDKINTNENGKKTIMLPNGDIKIDATRFAWDRDAAIVHPTLQLTIQYKMLDDLYSFVNDIQLSQKENTMHL